MFYLYFRNLHYPKIRGEGKSFGSLFMMRRRRGILMTPPMAINGAAGKYDGFCDGLILKKLFELCSVMNSVRYSQNMPAFTWNACCY
jgi:hypothetical protein